MPYRLLKSWFSSWLRPASGSSALAITLATTTLGFAVLRLAGQGRIALIRRVSSDGVPGTEAGIEANPNNFLVILSGVLLVLPGSITNLVGVILLIGLRRRWLRSAFRHVMGVREPARDGMFDLAANEWQEMPNREIENRHGYLNGR